MLQIDVTLLDTSKVRVRPTVLEQPASRPVFLRRLGFLTDRRWTDWLPVFKFLILHHEGYILFDAALSPHCKDRSYFPFWKPPPSPTSEIDLSEIQGVSTQLQNNGVESRDLRARVFPTFTMIKWRTA